MVCFSSLWFVQGVLSLEFGNGLSFPFKRISDLAADSKGWRCHLKIADKSTEISLFQILKSINIKILDAILRSN